MIIIMIMIMMMMTIIIQVVLIIRDLSQISRGEGGCGNFKFGFGNEVTNPCNKSEIC